MTTGSTTILASLDLTHKASANMRTLSGGMKRRVLVAQALVDRPPVIVLDEAYGGVDVELRQGLWQFVRKLNRDGHTIVLTTHYLEEAEALCGRIAMLKAGKVVALDTTGNLLRRFATHSLRVRVDNLDAALALGGLAAEDGWVEFGFDSYGEVESRLASLRESGAGLREMQLGEPDLERVFVEVMHRAVATSPRPAGRRPVSRADAGRFAADPVRSCTRRCCVSGGQLPDRRGAGAQCPAVPADLARARPPCHCLRRRGLHQFPGAGPGHDVGAQNAFANSSSSLIQSKITGNIIFVLLPPLSYREFYAAYVVALTLRAGSSSALACCWWRCPSWTSASPSRCGC